MVSCARDIIIFKNLVFCSEFCSMVRKIFIYTAEEVNKLSPKIRLSANEEVKPANLITTQL